MTHNNSSSKAFWFFVILLSLSGLILGIYGFRIEDKHDLLFSNHFYDAFQMFILCHSFHDEINIWLELSRWIIFLVFLLVTFQLFITIIAPKFIQYTKIRLFYKNHIVICGLNDISLYLINKFSRSRIVVIAAENNPFIESIKRRRVIQIIGDPSCKHTMKLARTNVAEKLFILTDCDEKNIKITQTVVSFLKKSKRNNPLNCFTIVKDDEMRIIMEETSLLKLKTHNIDCSFLNINEVGIKYGITVNIDKILPKKIQTPPEILLIDLTEKAISTLLNLAHCLTDNRETFRFTIVEQNTQKIESFQEKYAYLSEFAEIEFVNKANVNKIYDSVIVCSDNLIEAIKKAVATRYYFGKSFNERFIIVFCNETDTLNDIITKEFDKKNICFVNLFSQIAEYVFELDNRFEERAKEAHYYWNVTYRMDKEWDTISGHFKQSNRNQILDHYLKTFIILGEKFDEIKDRLISFTDKDKETLAMMEHRRWMLEKIKNGWISDERDNEFKRHDCLIGWEQLPVEQKAKDYNVIDLMIKLINNQNEH